MIFFSFVKMVALKMRKRQKPEACFFMLSTGNKLCLLDIQRNARRNFVNIGIRKFEIKENGLEG